MRKITRIMALFMVLFVVLTACGTKKVTTGDTSGGGKVSIVLQESGKEFNKKEIDIKPKEKLLSVMENNFKVIQDKNFITSIDGKAQDIKANKFWLYTVNGKMAEVGANEYELNDKDVVVFDLSVLEKK